MNQRQFDELRIRADAEFAHILQRLDKMWLGERLNYMEMPELEPEPEEVEDANFTEEY